MLRAPFRSASSDGNETILRFRRVLRRAEGRPTPLLLYDLYDKADTLLDVYSLQPQRSSIYSEEGKRHRTKVTILDRPAKKAHYEVQTRTVMRKDLAIPSSTADVLSTIYALRAMTLKQETRS